jgi:hypothetical protein
MMGEKRVFTKAFKERTLELALKANRKQSKIGPSPWHYREYAYTMEGREG